ncbi:MAG: SulP family inorganic anion transporter [Leptolyngbyaceae cyanobacterium SL_7_1]|nr:SulP family inorganic anion transporter [Leptolyngbyaceae cyanobacterium SL_7_1]
MNTQKLAQILWVQSFTAQLRHELHPPQFFPNLMVGLTTGAVGVLFDLSFAALIFSGSLSDHLSVGVGLVLFSVAATRVMTTLLSPLGVVTDLGTVPTAILAWSAGAIAKDLSPTASSAEILLTVLVAIALTSLITGVCLLLLGMLKVGEWVRSIPHAVVGGFVASTGWLLVKGGFKVMTEKPLGIPQLGFLLQPDVVIQWLPGLVLALYLFVIAQRRSHPAILSISLFGAVGLFYIGLLCTGTSIAQASVQGWTMSAITSSDFWQPLSPAAIAQVHWSVLPKQLTCMATVVAVTAISLLLNLTGLELVTKQELDVNRELTIAGVLNVFLGLGGGILSYHSLSKSVLAHKMGAKSRVTTLVEAGIFIAFPVVAISLVAYVPKAVLGGLLLFLGLSLLIEWMYTAWFKLKKTDYVVVQAIVWVSATVGFLQGLIIGWLLAAALLALSIVKRRQ